MLPRLAELEKDLHARRARAQAEGWLGEIEGIDLTLRFLADKQQQGERLQKITGTVELGIPTLRSPVSSEGVHDDGDPGQADDGADDVIAVRPELVDQHRPAQRPVL
jgi:hypothetical protein